MSPVGGIINFWLMFVEYEVWKTGESKSECESVCKCEYRSEGLDFDSGCFASEYFASKVDDCARFEVKRRTEAGAGAAGEMRHVVGSAVYYIEGYCFFWRFGVFLAG